MSQSSPFPSIRLMIAGAQKAGTTSLIRYLGQHPGVYTHKQAEISYFVQDEEYNQGLQKMFARYFPHLQSSQPILMAKSIAIMLLPTAMCRLHDHNRDIQVVVLLRHPIDRAYSSYWFAKRRGWETKPTFEEAIVVRSNEMTNPNATINRNYLENGLYAQHLQQLYACFSKSQIHVFLFEDFKANPVAICQSLYRLFPELDDNFEPITTQTYNPAAIHRSRSLALVASSRDTLPRIKRLARTFLPHKTVDRIRDVMVNANEQEISVPPMSPETRAHLISYFRPYNLQLSELIGRDLESWNQ